MKANAGPRRQKGPKRRVWCRLGPRCVFFQIFSSILLTTKAHSSQRRPPKANAGPRKPTAASDGQRRPMKADADQRRPTRVVAANAATTRDILGAFFLSFSSHSLILSFYRLQTTQCEATGRWGDG